MLLSLYTPVHVWAGCPWFRAGSLCRNSECVEGPEAQTAASSPPGPEIQISQSGIRSRPVLTALLYSALWFSTALAKAEALQDPLPAHPILSNPPVLHPCFSLFIFQIRPWLLAPLLFPTGFCGLFESSFLCLMSAHEISPRWHRLAPVFPALTGLVFF